MAPTCRHRRADGWRLCATVIVVCFALKALLGSLAAASAAAAVAEKPGTILMPICAGGVIVYVAMDLGGDGSDPSPGESDAAPVATDTCLVFGAFPVPDAAALQIAAVEWQAPPPHFRAMPRRSRRVAFPHAPLRGPPTSS
ncbi:MAG: hypothetical protein AAFR47_24545 [Pseudomonadota bacterium]